MADVMNIELLPDIRVIKTAIEVMVYIKPESMTIFIEVVSLLRGVANRATVKSSRSSRAEFSFTICQILYTIIAITTNQSKVNMCKNPLTCCIDI